MSFNYVGSAPLAGDTGERYFYALRRDDDGQLFIQKVDIASPSDAAQINRPGGTDGNYTEFQAGEDFFVGYSPERIDPGNKVWKFKNTPKVVSGINDISTEKIQSFYESIIENIVLVKGTKEAEMVKLLENTYRHVNIALINELAMLCKMLDIDIWEVVNAAKTKPFGFESFKPGPGVGGHCIPVDPEYLSFKTRQIAVSYTHLTLPTKA